MRPSSLARLGHAAVLATALISGSVVVSAQQWFGTPANLYWRTLAPRPDITVHLPDEWLALNSRDPVTRCRATMRWGRAIARPDAGWLLAGCPMLAGAIEWEDSPGLLLPYDEWTSEQQLLLDDIFQRLLANEPRLGISCPPASTAIAGDRIVYLTDDQAFSIYAAHVANALYLEMTRRVPWSIISVPHEELRALLASPAYFARLSGKLVNPPAGIDPARAFTLPTRIVVSDGLVCDPRVGYRFLSGVYSTGGENLIGDSEEDTLARITLWMSRDAGHGGPDDRTLERLRSYSYLDKRLQRRAYSEYPTAIMAAGCHSAASFIHDLAKSINIPVLPVLAYELPRNEWPSGAAPMHQGLAFHWARKDMRVAWHADDLYFANGMAINFPIGADGRRLSDADGRRLFFDVNWVAPSVLTAYGFEWYGRPETFPVAPLEYFVRFSEPVVGTWHSPGHQPMGYSWDKRFDLCSWRDFVMRGATATYDVTAQAAAYGPWTLSHPVEAFGPRAEACAAAYGGLDALTGIVNTWEAASGSNLYTSFPIVLFPPGLWDRFRF